MIKEIEVICKPCQKCANLKDRIRLMMDCLEFKNKIRYKYEFRFNPDIRLADKYGFNITQLPIVLINGRVEFVGRIKEDSLLRAKLEAINKEA